MAQLYWYRKRRTAWYKRLLPFAAIACIGFVEPLAAAPAQTPPADALPHLKCLPDEGSGNVAHGVKEDFAASNAEPTAPSVAFRNSRQDLSATAAVAGTAPLRVDDPPTSAKIFQAGIDEAVREFGKEPRSRHLTPQQRQARAEFVFGNMLFVTIHELGHALISEFDLSVLGREEDAADAYATLGALKCGAAFSRRVLVEAAKAWFMTAQRDRQTGEVPRYYERHGLDAQRAYQIVCLMVGSDPIKFRDLADETGLPEERRRSCGWDYDTASRSWDRTLARYQHAADLPKAPIQVVYEEGKGKLAVHARIFSATRFLETIVEQVAARFAWPAPIVVQMQSCGEPNARWTNSARKLHVCYELAQEFVELYHDFGVNRTLAQVRLGSEQRVNAGRQKTPQSFGAWKRLRGSKIGHRSAH